jgi:hypothetical protein
MDREWAVNVPTGITCVPGLLGGMENVPRGGKFREVTVDAFQWGAHCVDSMVES